MAVVTENRGGKETLLKGDILTPDSGDQPEIEFRGTAPRFRINPCQHIGPPVQ